MTATERERGFPLAEAERLAVELLDRLSPACERIQIAGSVRRGKPGIRPHDYEGFTEELLRYGAWHGDLRRMSETVRQLPLAGIEGRR